MQIVQANPMWYSNNNPLGGLSQVYLDDILEDQPFIWLENIGFITVSKAQLMQSLYYFQRDLHMGKVSCTLARLYFLLGISTKLKNIVSSETNEYINTYGWCMEYIYDMGYSWLDFYFKKGKTSHDVTYYEIDTDIEPIDLTVPFDAD